jgi:hypothetical protein
MITSAAAFSSAGMVPSSLIITTVAGTGTAGYNGYHQPVVARHELDDALEWVTYFIPTTKVGALLSGNHFGWHRSTIAREIKRHGGAADYRGWVIDA